MEILHIISKLATNYYITFKFTFKCIINIYINIHLLKIIHKLSTNAFYKYIK